MGSFSNGLDVFKKLRERKQRRKWSRKNENADPEEVRLTRSLRQGQEDIGREYQNSVYAAGDQFAIGDGNSALKLFTQCARLTFCTAIAQTSLAEILLRLNTGLVGIIASFVNSDKKNVHLDYQSLTDISERSRVDTCRTLRHLFKRLTHMRPQLASTVKKDAEGRKTTMDRHTSGRKRRKASTGHTKVRGPMLAQVVIADSSKPPQIALVKPGERRKKSSASSGSASSLSRGHSNTSTAATTPPPAYAPEEFRRPPAYRSNSTPDTAPKPRRKHSAADIARPTQQPRGEAMRAARSTPQLESTLPQHVDPLPPMPKTAPLLSDEVSPMLPRRRKETPTYYSVASDATKLGEIPLHKWTVPYDFDQMSILNKEAYQSGWPLNQLENQGKRKRGLFRLFGRRSD